MLKLVLSHCALQRSLITVQDNTMLKPEYDNTSGKKRLITVQDNTMLKRHGMRVSKVHCLITVQDNTMLKQISSIVVYFFCLITVQDNTMLKPQIQASLRTTRRNPKRYFLLSYFYYITSFVLTQLFRIDPDL